jgi:hypothetical protein
MRYYYRVRAISNCSQSDWSQPVKIRIALSRYTLNVQSTPINGGYIADHQVNHFIFCPMNQCMSDYYENALITLFATPYPEFSIKEWAGCEKIQNNQCIVTMNKHQNVRVSFECNDIQTPEMTTLIKEIKPNEPYILVWNEVPGAIQYELEESISPDFSKNIQTINTTDLSQVFIKEQLEQSEFFYRVSAMRSCGSQSEWSKIIRLNNGIRSKQNIDLQSGWNWILDQYLCESK